MKTNLTFSLDVKLREKMEEKVQRGAISAYLSRLIEEDLSVSEK